MTTIPPADAAARAIEQRLIRLNITDCDEHYNPAIELGCWDVMDYGAIAQHLVSDIDHLLLSEADTAVLEAVERFATWMISSSIGPDASELLGDILVAAAERHRLRPAVRGEEP